MTGNYFQLLGADAVLGRTFVPEENRLFDPRNVVILSETMWRDRFSADPAIVGKPIRLNDRSFTVIGVIGAKFSRLRHFFEMDLFVPATAMDVLSGRIPLATPRAATGRDQSSGRSSLTSAGPDSSFCSAGAHLALSLEQIQAKLRLVAS